MLNTCHHSAVDVVTSANSSSSSLKRGDIIHFCFGPMKVKGWACACVYNLQICLKYIYEHRWQVDYTIPNINCKTSKSSRFLLVFFLTTKQQIYKERVKVKKESVTFLLVDWVCVAGRAVRLNFFFPVTQIRLCKIYRRKKSH